ncbi:MAG: aldo/keto reductase [Chloroflexi bacterium]|nr:MAG: aldo/keto reductase [Chloroflexota bacterium]MBL1195392.1 aldo/keto reductase [Chloroflexota bacterium]NOH12675.1 aldo/keto reductase [Chloroflexota bacterium]
MQPTELGKSGLSVTRIGLGLAALGRPGYINLGHSNDLQSLDQDAMQAQAHKVLGATWKAGIRYFDAARSYGLAERFLGSWLKARDISSDGVTVGSKWGYTYTADWQVEAENHEIKEHSLPVLQRQIKESLGELGEYLKLYQIHSATLDSGVLDNQAVLDELARLKADGLSIGLSLSGTKQAEMLEKALTIEYDGQLLFDGVQATWNMLEPSAGEVLAAAHQAGLGIIIKEALANGRLTPRNDQPQFTEQRDILEGIAVKHETGIDAVALAYVLAQGWVDVVLSGAATIEHVLSNVQAIDIQLDEANLDALDGLAESSQEYWETRSKLAWN